MIEITEAQAVQKALEAGAMGLRFVSTGDLTDFANAIAKLVAEQYEAQLAGAYLAAANLAETDFDLLGDELVIADKIRALTPADAQAALDKHVQDSIKSTFMQMRSLAKSLGASYKYSGPQTALQESFVAECESRIIKEKDNDVIGKGGK